MSDELWRDANSFPDFWVAVHKGLAKAVFTDIDVLLLLEMGMLLTSKKRLGKAAGVGLAGYLVARRANQYLAFIGSKADAIVQVMDERDWARPDVSFHPEPPGR